MRPSNCTHRMSAAQIHLYICAQRILLFIIHLILHNNYNYLIGRSHLLQNPQKSPVVGVCCDVVPYQVNYLVDEACTIVENGLQSRSSNSVISMLHHFFDQHSLGETEVKLHADNCRGQKKDVICCLSLLAVYCWIAQGDYLHLHACWTH